MTRKKNKPLTIRESRKASFDKSDSSSEFKIDKITYHFEEIMKTLGLDLTHGSLKDSPRRVAKMYVNELFWGLDPKHFPKMTLIENDLNYDQMVLVRDIRTLSTCEHHFVTIDGKATVAYIPKKRVIGLSKLNRIVDYYSRRPQVQERLTKDVADCLERVLGTEDVAVAINAKHFCVIQRGIQDSESTTFTCDLRGAFKLDAKTRIEFMTASQQNSMRK